MTKITVTIEFENVDEYRDYMQVFVNSSEEEDGIVRAEIDPDEPGSAYDWMNRIFALRKIDRRKFNVIRKFVGKNNDITITQLIQALEEDRIYGAGPAFTQTLVGIYRHQYIAGMENRERARQYYERKEKLVKRDKHTENKFTSSIKGINLLELEKDND